MYSYIHHHEIWDGWGRVKEADEQIMNPDLTKVQCLRGRAIAFLYLINHMHLLDENQNAGTGHALKIIFHVL